MTTGQHRSEPPTTTGTPRIDNIDRASILAGLDDVGVAAAGPVLAAAECDALIAVYDIHDRFRSTIDMGRHRFGQGQYRYFANPLPTEINELRRAFWPHLLPIARESSSSSNNAHAHSPEPPPPRSREATPSPSPLATIPCAPLGDGPKRPCATASAPCEPVDDTPSDSSFTAPRNCKQECRTANS